MNQLTQQESLLIGAQDEIKKLEQKNKAKLLVISDSHGDYDVLYDIILNFGEDCDSLIFCGDGICDIATLIANAHSDEKLKKCLPPVIAITQGNGDSERYRIEIEDQENNMPWKILSVPPRSFFTVCSRNILVVHGHRYGVGLGTETLRSTASVMDADMIFYGHTHIPYWEENKAALILNPGSCSRPRGGYPASFAVVSFPGVTERYSIDFFEAQIGLFGQTNFKPFRIPANQ